MREPALTAPPMYEREADLAAALAARDPGAWRQLFDEHYDRVYGYAYVRTGNAADADDIAATTFAEAVKGIDGFRYRGIAVAAWLFRIAHNETADLLKRRIRTAATSLAHPEAAAALQARDEIAPAGDWRDLSDALGALKQEHREVVVLRLVEGRSVRDVALLLGKTEGAIKVMQMRALRALRQRLNRSG